MIVTFRYTSLLAGLALLVTAPTAQAQSASGPALRILAGATAATLADGSSSTDPLYGMALGAQWVLPARGAWSLVPELLLADKGGRQTSGGASADADLRVLDFSLLGRWNRGNTEQRTRFFAFGGPSFGYVVGCDAETGGGGVTLTGDCIDNVNRGDISVTLGGGLEFPTSAIDWGVSLRYQHGLADVLKGSGEIRTRTLLLMLSYRL